MSHTPTLGPSEFRKAHGLDRVSAAEARLNAAAESKRRLHKARDAFCEHACEVYASGAAAAERDSDTLELLADQLAAALEGLHPTFERLDVARDLALYRGPVVSRMRARFDVSRLAALTAEALAEELLSTAAGAVLLAAVAHRTG